MEVVYDCINGCLLFIGVGDLFVEEQGLKVFNIGWVDLFVVGGLVEFNLNLIELIKIGQEDQIQSEFDWNEMDLYCFILVMLYGILVGNVMFFKVKQNQVLNVRVWKNDIIKNYDGC